MMQTQSNLYQSEINNANSYQLQENTIDLLDLIIIIAKHKKFILGLTCLVITIACIYSFMVTPVYRSTTKILLPSESSSKIALLSQIPGFAADALSLKTNGDMMVGMIKSRTLADKLIKRFNLEERFEVENIDQMRRILSNMTQANADGKSGLVSISIEYSDPVFASTLANAYVEELKVFMQQLAISDAAQKRLFLEEQLKETQVHLLKAENELAGYQKRTGILNANQYASSLMSAIATFRARISAKEVELQAAETFASGNNPRVQKLKAEVKGLKEQIQKLEAQATHGSEESFNLNELPDAGMEYLRKLRDQRFYEALYGMLMKQYEQAKMAEAQEPMVIQIIDEAVIPYQKVRPQKKLIVVLSAILGLFMSLFLAFFLEFIHIANSVPERKEKLDLLKEHLGFEK